MSTADSSHKNVRRPRDVRRDATEAPPPRRGTNRRVDVVPASAAEPSGPSRFARLRRWFAARAPDLSMARLRDLASGIARLAVVLLVLVGAAASARLVERYVRTSPAFAIRTLSVRGSATLSSEEVLRTAGVQIGQNVFDMPPEDVRARLERHPWIAHATVRRRLPGAVEIEIVERRAVAALLLDDLYLVGEDASVFKTREPHDPFDLPVITLADAGRWLADRAALTTLLLDAVALIHDFRRFGVAGHASLEELHVEEDDGLTLYVGAEATRIALGRAPFDRKLRRLRVLFEELERRDASPAYVLLDHERRTDRVVVRLRETVVPLPLMDDSAGDAPAPSVAGPRRAG